MKRIALSEIEDRLSKYLRVAQKDRMLITRHGEPAGIPIGFKDENDWFDYQLENDPRSLPRIDRARLDNVAGTWHAARGYPG